MPQSNEYPKEIVTTEKATEASEEKQVVTVVGNEYEEKAVEAAIAYMNAFNEKDVYKCNASSVDTKKISTLLPHQEPSRQCR